MNKLPDELLKEILKPPLLVPDAMFASTSNVSPFSKVTHSASAVLLVCKRWMRVATPTLYATVVIRSQAQARALCMALTRNPEFGLYVKKLGLEGVYHEWLTPTMFRAMPKVNDFCFTLSVWTTDKLSGLQAAFRTFDPVRVVLTLSGRLNKTRSTLVSELCTAIDRWKNLTQFAVPSDSPYSQFRFDENLRDALAQSLSLKIFESSRPGWHKCYNALPTAQLGSGLQKILTTSRSIKTVKLHITGPLNSYDFDGIDPRVQVISGGRVIRGEFGTMNQANEFWRPMESTTKEIRVEIWTKIIRFATVAHHPSVDENDSNYDTWGDRQRRVWHFRPELLYFYSEKYDLRLAGRLNRVSREFYRATMTALSTDVRLVAVASRNLLEKTRPYAFSHIRSFELDEESLSLVADGPGMIAAMHHLRELRFRPTGSGGDLFSCIAPAVRQNLRVLSLRGPKHSIHHPNTFEDSFTGFDNLRRLNWDHDMVSFRPGSRSDRTSLLPALMEIYVETAHPSVWAGWTRCGLPSITQVAIKSKVRAAEPFLKAHGSKLTHLASATGLRQTDMACMSSLRYVRFFADVLPTRIATLSSPTVESFQLNWSCSGSGAKRYLQLYTALRADIATKWPALRTVVARESDAWGDVHARLWPTNERDEKNSRWPELAVNFEKHGVKLVDGKRQGWRERLKVGTS